MNELIDSLRDLSDEVFDFFERVYLFGSSLYMYEPNDIDIILVYDKNKLERLEYEKARVEKELAGRLGDMGFDFTTLNQSELTQTAFLACVPHVRIKE